MNGISNGDGTYKQLSNSDALVGMASDLPNPQKSVTQNLADLKLKSATASGTTGANGVFAVAMPSNRIVLSVTVTTNTVYYADFSRYSNGYYFCISRLDNSDNSNVKVKNTNVTLTYYYIDL